MDLIMRYFIALLFCFSLAAQQTVNNFTVKTNLTVAGAPVTLSVNTIADLKALNPVADNAQVSVAGYYSPNDGADGLFRRVLSSSITNAGSITFDSIYNPSYGWSRIWDGTTVKAQWFGAFAGDGISDSSAIQAAMDYVHSLGRGSVELDGGRYDIDATLRVPYRVNLIGAKGWKLGEYAASISTNQVFLTGGPTMLRLMDGANVDMLWLDSTDGYIRQPNETLEDGEVVDSRFQDSLIENLIFFGNAANQTKYNIRGIAAKAKWTGNIHNCAFVYIPGHALWLFDCNAFIVDNIWISAGGGSFFGKGIFTYSSADNFFGRIYAGGARGPIAWWDSSSTFKNVHREWILFNAYRTNTLNTIDSWTTNTLANFSNGIPLESGEPVELRTTGSLPSGFSDTQLYFAVKIATNVYGFHTNYALATNGIYISGSGTPSGTSYLTLGPPTGLYLSGGAGQNVFNGLRSDQNSGPGIVIRQGTGNYISGLEAGENNGIQNGEAIPSEDNAAVIFDKGSSRNSIAGAIYQQNVAYNVRSNATENVMTGVYTSVLTNIVNSSTGINYEPINKDLSGSASFGTSSTQTALNLTGNSGGARIIKLSRTSGITQQIGLGVGQDALNVWNETLNRGIGLIGNSGTTAFYQMGDASSATPPIAEIYGSAGSGSNISGSAIRLYADRSTGNADVTDAFSVLTGDAGSSGSSAQSMTSKFVVEGDGDVRVVVGDVFVSTAGKSIKIKEGTNAKMGTAVLAAGTVVVSTTAVASNSRIILTSNTDGGTPGWLRVSARTANTSFTITSSSATDTSTVAWIIFDPAP